MQNRDYPIVDLDYWSDFASRLVDLLDLQKGMNILDVGTGWSACTLAAIEKLGNTGHVTGIDFNENIIPVAIENLKNAGISNASVQLMNAQAMTFEDNLFDTVISGFMGFSDVYDFTSSRYKTENKKMEEIIRVLRRERKAGFSTWLLQEDIEVFRGMLISYIKSLQLNDNNLDIENMPIGYSKETVEGFTTIMKDSGFRDVQIIQENFRMVYPDRNKYWEIMKTVARWLIKYSIGLEPEMFMEFEQSEAVRELDKYRTESGYSFVKSVIFTIGRK